MSSRTLRRRSTYRALGKHKQHHSRPILRVLVVLFVSIAMLTSGASATAIFFYGNNLPSLKSFKARFQFQNTLIRDYQGNILYDMADVSTKGRGRRVVEPLRSSDHTTQQFKQNKQDWLVGPNGNGIPLLLQDATIATEDASFYNNLGFDPFSIVRAGYDNLIRGHIVSGASTITQQLVREYMLDSNQQTVGRKAQEIILAAELTQKYSKTKILWYYLNSVPYGNQAYGAQAAARQYFGRDVWNLDLAQSALLAGLPEAPSIYDPVNDLPTALSRMRYVLHLMCVHGYLPRDPDQTCDTTINASVGEIQTFAKKHGFRPPITLKKYPHFVEYATQQLEALSQSIPALKNRVYDGLDVQTTLDWRLQDAAQSVVRNQISGLGAFNVSDGALVSIDMRPGNYGRILAMVGSADYRNTQISGQINMATRPRQPGSSFKPFNYVYAFQKGAAPNTTVLDAPVAIPDTGNPDDGGWYEPQNYDHAWHGTVTLRVALANSLNIPAVKVEQFGANASSNGLLAIRDQAERLGIHSLSRDNPHCCGWALTLGGMEHGVRLVEETAAFGAFGSGGYTVPPLAIWRVKDRASGKVLFYAPRDAPDPFKKRQVLAPPYAYLMNNVLSDNASRCTAAVCEFGLDSQLNLGRTAAAKTGTTNAFTDNWTVGYTPDIVTGVWVGNADNSAMQGTTGVTGAAPIWHDFMLKAFDVLHLPPKDFTQPPDVQAGSACRQNTSYYSLGSTVYDVYAGVIPLCSVGTYNTGLPVPPPVTSYQPPAVQQPQTQVRPTAAPTPIVPTALPQSVQGVQPGNPGAVVQPTSLPVAPGVQPTTVLPPGIKPVR